MKPIRILHIVGIMNRGGLETLLMNIYRNIDRNKIQFDFLVHFEEEGAYEEEISNLGGRIYRINHITKVGPFMYSKQIKQFFNVYKDYKIVHSHMDAMSGIILREVKKCGIPIRIAHSHNAYPKMGMLEKIYKNYSKSIINRNCTDKFACSKMAGEWLFGNQSEGNEVVILKNAIHPDKFKFNNKKRKEKREALGISEETLVIGNIARFNKQKNHDFIIDIYDNLKRIKKESKLVLIGDGILKKSIEDKCKTLDLENDVIFLGVREDVQDLLQVMDIFLFPSLHEGLGIVLVEAQSNGLKCIASSEVPQEADMKCNLVEFISLSNSAYEWADEIINQSDYKRNNNKVVDKVKDNGYDISVVANWITTFYEEKQKISII